MSMACWHTIREEHGTIVVCVRCGEVLGVELVPHEMDPTIDNADRIQRMIDLQLPGVARGDDTSTYFSPLQFGAEPDE